MMELLKVRNMTPEDRDCPWAGPHGSGALIKSGEVGLVPRDVYDQLDWSHGMFELLNPPKK